MGGRKGGKRKRAQGNFFPKFTPSNEKNREKRKESREIRFFIPGM